MSEASVLERTVAGGLTPPALFDPWHPLCHYHPASGNKITGHLLVPGETVYAQDVYADLCGGWLNVRPQDVGQKVALGCTTLFVRPNATQPKE